MELFSYIVLYYKGVKETRFMSVARGRTGRENGCNERGRMGCMNCCGIETTAFVIKKWVIE